MNTINIVCKLNNDDNFSISTEALEVNLANKEHYHYTFWDTGIKHNKILKSLPKFYSIEGLDLLYLSLFVFYADRKIQREMFPDAWTRKIKLYVPVLSLEKWIPQKESLEEMLSFLSGDIWDIQFRERELNNIEKDFQKKLERDKGEKLNFETFCMLSGGLDSYIGAIDLLEQSDNVAFVNHYGGGSSGAKFIEYVETSLKNEYTGKNAEIFKFHAAPLNGIEDSTRTRSFMFFAHAIALASAMNHGIDLIIPENGLISLNIPLTNSRLGSSSTRTTHPYYMGLLQELIGNLGIQVALCNPYQFKTKGEMIHECRNDVLLTGTLAGTMSCSHPDIGRYLGESKPSHCGTCLPCIIRRASIKKANMEDNSIYRDLHFLSGKTATNNLNAYKMGIAKYKDSSINIYSKIQMAGPLYGELNNYKSLYERGMQELIDLLE
jgi:hypothetical protein